MNKSISSVRPIEWQAQYPVAVPPPPAPAYDYRRRPDEHLFEVPVHSVRVVVGPPEQLDGKRYTYDGISCVAMHERLVHCGFRQALVDELLQLAAAFDVD